LLGVKLSVSVLRRVVLAGALLCLTIIGSMAVDSRLNAWLAVPKDQGGLVFVIDNFWVESVTFADEKRGVFDVVKWNSETPFIHQIRLKPGEYSVRLPGPLSAITVRVRAGTLTYLTFGPIKGVPGTQIAVSYDKSYLDAEYLLEERHARASVTFLRHLLLNQQAISWF
jgi:hypothetical protein